MTNCILLAGQSINQFTTFIFGQLIIINKNIVRLNMMNTLYNT